MQNEGDSSWADVLVNSDANSITLNVTIRGSYVFRACTTNAANLTGPYGSEVRYSFINALMVTVFQVFFVVPGLPGAPDAPSVSAYDNVQNAVTISWDAPSDTGGASNLTYNVQYSGGNFRNYFITSYQLLRWNYLANGCF